ncbi:MAG: hypothetical protein IPN38_10530 [Flavobacteriales bacterium]|nr:hypothetical protein [Flavobacteriales bacterium]
MKRADDLLGTVGFRNAFLQVHGLIDPEVDTDPGQGADVQHLHEQRHARSMLEIQHDQQDGEGQLHKAHQL